MNYFYSQNKQHGFTVIEMIVVISIFSILGGILMFNYKGFQKNQDFSVFAQEVGLLVKEQQQNAMAGVFPAINPNDKIYPPLDWKPAYGVYIHPAAALSNAFIVKFYDGIYVDQAYNMPGSWDPSLCSVQDNECLSLFSVENGREIYGIFEGGYYPGIPQAQSLDNISIVFTRPYPDAHMYKNYPNNYDSPTNAVAVTDTVDIVFKDPGVDGVNIVSINPTGAISIRRDQ
jgi:prepilin-type N-terminal cleavage/methylation domain-containing protein